VPHSREGELGVGATVLEGKRKSGTLTSPGNTSKKKRKGPLKREMARMLPNLKRKSEKQRHSAYSGFNKK